MKKVKVLLSFIKLMVSAKIAFCRNVINKMTGNDFFSEPDVELTVLNTLVTKLETANSNALSGSHEAIAQRNRAVLEVDEAFRKAALYVDRIADGDTAIILSSGFQATKRPEPAQRPQFLVEASANSGEVTLNRRAQAKARAYIWQYSVGVVPPNGTGSWVYAGASTKGKFTIGDLESGTKCWFRVAAVTTDGVAPWSDPIMKVIP